MTRIRMHMQHVAVAITQRRIADEYRQRRPAASSAGPFIINAVYEVENIINLTSLLATLTIMAMRLPVIGLVGVVGRITGRVRCPYE